MINYQISDYIEELQPPHPCKLKSFDTKSNDYKNFTMQYHDT